MNRSSGFSLLETMVALSLLVAVVLSLVQVSIYTARSNALARDMTLATALASEKLEQLLTLAWGYDGDGVLITDLGTDMTTTPERSGGVGLQASPMGSLDQDADGYCDFLDGSGRSLGGGSSPPSGAVLVRRWAIMPLAASPDGLVLQVRLLSRSAAERNSINPGSVTLTTIRSRVVR